MRRCRRRSRGRRRRHRVAPWWPWPQAHSSDLAERDPRRIRQDRSAHPRGGPRRRCTRSGRRGHQVRLQGSGLARSCRCASCLMCIWSMARDGALIVKVVPVYQTSPVFVRCRTSRTKPRRARGGDGLDLAVPNWVVTSFELPPVSYQNDEGVRVGGRRTAGPDLHRLATEREQRAVRARRIRAFR